jgi:dihydroorotase
MKAFLGPTTGRLGPPADDALRDALATGRRVAVHAEDEWEIESNIQALPERGRTSPRAHLLTRTPETEVMAIAHLGKLVLEAGGAAHVVHVTSSAGLEAVLRWRDRGADLTCELTPHHALLDHAVYDRFGGIAKVNPPIRGEPHASALLAALADGSIDTIASDHAPHLESDKRRASIWDVAAGIPGVETMLPLMLTEVADRRLSLERLVHATSEMPARIWGLWPGKGAIAVGSDADLTLIDLDRPGEVRAAEMHGKNNVTPFEGRSTRGAVVATIVRGRTVMRDGRLVAQPGWGRPVSRS